MKIHECHPEYLPGDSIKWNLIGKVIKRFETTKDRPSECCHLQEQRSQKPGTGRERFFSFF